MQVLQHDKYPKHNDELNWAKGVFFVLFRGVQHDAFLKLIFCAALSLNVSVVIKELY
jgi:hypothetical protein